MRIKNVSWVNCFISSQRVSLRFHGVLCLLLISTFLDPIPIVLVDDGGGAAVGACGGSYPICHLYT